MIVDLTGLKENFKWMTDGYVYKKVHDKKIPYIKEGKKLLFDTEAVENYYKSFAVPTESELTSETIGKHL
jgi:excisionase family DNA binding protein